MKKYLLFIISMLCVSIGTWADIPDGAYNFGKTPFTGSYFKVDDVNKTVTVHIATRNDLSYLNVTAGTGTNADNTLYLSDYSKVIVTGEMHSFDGASWSSNGHGSDGHNLYKFKDCVLDLSEATLVPFKQDYASDDDGYVIGSADAHSKNIIVPSGTSLATFKTKVHNPYGTTAYTDVNYYTVSGTTITANINNTSDLCNLNLISTTSNSTLKLDNDIAGTIDLSEVASSTNSTVETIDLTNVTTTGTTATNPITVASNVKVVCLTDGVKARVSGTDDITVVDPVISCKASQLSEELPKRLDNGITPTSITIIKDNENPANNVLTDLSQFNIEGLEYLSLQGATLSGININTLPIPSTLQALTLPKSEDPKASFDAMKTNIEGKTALYYVYAPYSGTQDKDQMVADYVWVNKPGGLAKAFDDQTRLLSAWYMIVESTVALNDGDVNFWGSDPGHARPMQYRYLDLSGANITPAVLANYKVTDELPYRIILPNDWTGDMMAVFAANPNKGSIAAVYSYTGTDHKRLDILELNDYAYLSTALSDSRIVRSETTSIRVVSGHYGSNPVYSKFGDNLLTAINGAASSITSVTIAVGTGIYESVDTNSDSKDDTDLTITGAKTFEFTNTYLTDLTLSYINNQHVTIDVTGCTALTNLQMNEATVAAVDAHGLINLATVSLGHTTVGGDVNLSNTNSTNTSLTSDLEVDLANIGGTLNVSGTNATSFDFSKLTAKSVDASNTTALTSLNLNGIKLDGMPASGTDAITQTNIDDRIGTVEVTRSGNNYSGLNIITASAAEFATNRIVPSDGNYTRTAIEPAHIEITAAGSDLSTTAHAAVTVYNNAQDPVESNTVGNVEILHVTGTLTADDITYIKNNLTGLKQLDLSGCTFADGVGVSNIISAAIPTTVAIVLPGTSNTANVMALQDAGYECVAYYTSKANKRLNVYAYNGTVGNLKSTNPAIIDTNTGITLLPRYTWDSYTSQYVYQFTQAQPSLLTALGTLPPFSIDMTWLDIDKLGTDFSGLNSDTHYLIIPQNSNAATVTRNGIGYDNDFTVEEDETHVSTPSYKYYKYKDDVYAVSTYKSNVAPYATMAYFDGESYQYGPGVGYGQVNNTANITYVRKPGNLGSVMSNMSTELKNADILTIVGTIDSEDLVQYETTTSLSDATNKYLDLTHATFATTGENPITANSWSAYSNSSVESIAMPYGYSSTLAGLPTVGTCANLKGIGCLLKSDDVYESDTKKSTLVYQSYKEGGVGKIIPMLHALNLYDNDFRITSLTVGGPVNARDLANNYTGIDENGHLITSVDANNVMTVSGTGNSGSLYAYAGVMDYWDLSKVTLPNYNTRDGKDYCFDNSTHTYATSGTSTDGFSYQNDLCFSMIGLVPDSYDPFSCELPTDESVWRLPTKAFYNGHGMAELNLPFNYQYIGNSAFTDTYLTHITTTDASGNIVDNGPNSYTLSANLKEVGDNPGAGKALDADQTVFPQNREVYDVYVLATDVPKCYANAFAANVLYGWGGFQGGEFPYCRDKYINGSNWFCVLRYPYKAAWDAAHSTSGARESGFDLASRRAAPTTTPNLANGIDSYEEMEAAYTDVYKIYTKKEQTGAVDANGNAILWPTFSELQRVSYQALTNEVWNDWNTAYNGQQEVNTDESYSGDFTKKIDKDVSKHYNFEEYKGWHQFVLTQATYVEPDHLNTTERNFVEGGWYTFCIPFDLTESQVYEMLGVPYSDARYTNKVSGNTIKKAGDGEPGIERILPNIRTLASVTRKPGNTNQISLLLTSNMVTTSAGENTFYYYNINDANPASSALAPITETIGGEKIAIKGGYPYYIKPYLPEGVTVTNLGKYVMTRYADIFKQEASCQRNSGTVESINKSALATLQFAKPFEKHKIQAYLDKPGEEGYTKHHDNDVDPSNDKKYYYTFIGQFWDQKLPRYCYYTMEGTGNWYRFSDFTQEELYKWYAYKCVILVTQEVDDTEAHPQSGKFRDATNCFYPTIEAGSTDKLDGTLSLAFLDGIDDYDFANSARECIFLFDEDIMDLGDGSETTSIESLNGEDIVSSAKGKVYNMAGQHVGNSLEGLSKGMYIMNGKKYVIK